MITLARRSFDDEGRFGVTVPAGLRFKYLLVGTSVGILVTRAK
jgi:hypothetical protein